MYTARENTRVREAWYNEYGYTSEGSVGGIWKLWKFAAKETISIAGYWKGHRTRTVNQFKTYYTPWETVDEAASTIKTSC
ncbi:MAG: hypothetical protein R3249_05645 [Nitriliruptorales bacterium]|nr:hypothetical protein [Nitriliruptorales bacterium]